jgi:hypothetical protein
MLPCRVTYPFLLEHLRGIVATQAILDGAEVIHFLALEDVFRPLLAWRKNDE